MQLAHGRVSPHVQLLPCLVDEVQRALRLVGNPEAETVEQRVACAPKRHKDWTPRALQEPVRHRRHNDERIGLDVHVADGDTAEQHAVDNKGHEERQDHERCARSLVLSALLTEILAGALRRRRHSTRALLAGIILAVEPIIGCARSALGAAGHRRLAVLHLAYFTRSRALQALCLTGRALRALSGALLGAVAAWPALDAGRVHTPLRAICSRHARTASVGPQYLSLSRREVREVLTRPTSLQAVE
mmetsp:Transcript_41862/g.120987  ORF Transcript_41862/g.120987 Transcript_41862/m.120987 type:complete len:246 (-) Transcript_41862:143-880(-)